MSDEFMDWHIRFLEARHQAILDRADVEYARDLGKRTHEARSQTAGHSSPMEDALQDATQADWTEWLEFGGFW